MSFGGFGGFGEDESQEVSAVGRTPTRSFTSNNSGDKQKMRNVQVSIRTALDSALFAKDAVDLPIIYEVPVKYVEVVGQIESVTFDSSSLVCVVDDGTGRITLKQYLEQAITTVEGEESPFASFMYVELICCIYYVLKSRVIYLGVRGTSHRK